MTVSLSIYGKDFKAYDFLLAVQQLPYKVDLWDSEEVAEKNDGCTLVFAEEKRVTSLPFSLGRFLLANKEFLKANEFYSQETVRDLTFHISQSDIEYLAANNQLMIYIFNPALMKLLSELDIHFYITKTS